MAPRREALRTRSYWFQLHEIILKAFTLNITIHGFRGSRPAPFLPLGCVDVGDDSSRIFPRKNQSQPPFLRIFSPLE
jgi:hypothetical protein